MAGHGENLQTVLAGQFDALLGVGLGPGVAGAALQVQLPACFFPAIEAGFLQELDPAVHRHVAELAAHETDLMVRGFAETMRCGLFVTHARRPFPKNPDVKSWRCEETILFRRWFASG